MLEEKELESHLSFLLLVFIMVCFLFFFLLFLFLIFLLGVKGTPKENESGWEERVLFPIQSTEEHLGLKYKTAGGLSQNHFLFLSFNF